MHAGKLVFAQVMEFAPWHTFRRLVAKYRGDFNVRTFICLDQFLCMAFAQLTYRESLRDIEACLGAQPAKLYHLGVRGNVSRSNLADANEARDWRIHCEFAHQALIRIARRLYAEDPLAVDLDNTVYALDSTTIDLCLSLFPWAPFRDTKAAIKLHTLLDLRGAIPAFIFISDGKLHDVNMLDILLPEPGAFYVMGRGYLDFERLYALHQAGSFFVTRAKSNFKCKRIYSSPVDRSTGLICDQQVELTVFCSKQGYPERLRRIRYKDPDTGKTLVFLTNHFGIPALSVCGLYKSRWQVELFFKDQAAPAHQAVLRHFRERRQEPGMDRRGHLCAGGHRQEANESRSVVAWNATNPERDAFRESPVAPAAYRYGTDRGNRRAQ